MRVWPHQALHRCRANCQNSPFPAPSLSAPSLPNTPSPSSRIPASPPRRWGWSQPGRALLAPRGGRWEPGAPAPVQPLTHFKSWPADGPWLPFCSRQALQEERRRGGYRQLCCSPPRRCCWGSLRHEGLGVIIWELCAGHRCAHRTANLEVQLVPGPKPRRHGEPRRDALQPPARHRDPHARDPHTAGHVQRGCTSPGRGTWGARPVRGSR